MKRVLCAVDDTKGSLKVAEIMQKLFSCMKPDEVVLLYVEKIEGPSVLDDLIVSESEMQTLKESIEGTPAKEELDKRAQKIIEYYTERLKQQGITNIKPVVRMGHPAEEILATAEELDVELIVVGSRGRRLHNLFIGSVSREVVNKADRAVLVAR